MNYLLPAFVLFSALLVWVNYLLTKERDFWIAKHDALRLEIDTINHGMADAAMQRIYGQPIFGQKPEPQKAARAFELGHDRAERERQEALLKPDAPYVTDELTDDDIQHLDSLKGRSIS